MSKQTCKSLFETFTKSFKDVYIWIEDVYITGILSVLSNIELIDLRLLLRPGTPRINSKFLAAGLRKNYLLKDQERIWKRFFPIS